MTVKRINLNLDDFKETIKQGDVDIPDGFGKKLVIKPKNHLLYTDGKKAPKYVFKALQHIDDLGEATLIELAELYGFHKGDKKKTMESGLRRASEECNINLEITITNGVVMYKGKDVFKEK